MGELRQAECDADFAWLAWKAQAEVIDSLHRRIAELEDENRMLRLAATAPRSAGPSSRTGPPPPQSTLVCSASVRRLSVVSLA